MFCCYSCYAKHYGSEFGALKMFKQFPPNKNKYPEILEYPYFWDTPRKSKDQTLSIGSRESLHGSSERPFFIWSWTFRDHICMYITVYTSIYSITSIIYIIYKAIDIVMIYTYIYKIHIYIYYYILYVIYIYFVVPIIELSNGHWRLPTPQPPSFPRFFLAVVKGCVCFQGKQI